MLITAKEVRVKAILPGDHLPPRASTWSSWLGNLKTAELTQTKQIE